MPSTIAEPAPSQLHSDRIHGDAAEYKVVIYQEGMLGSLLLGSAKVDPVKFTAFLNQNARQGWRVVTMEKDMRRMLLFWKREAYLVIMERTP